MAAVQDDSLAPLRGADAVMEPDVLTKLGLFIAQGGAPKDAAVTLARGYRGKAELVNTLASWSALLASANRGDEAESVALRVAHEECTAQLQELVVRRFVAPRADKVFSEYTARPIWLAALLEQPSWRRTFYALADDHPNSLVLDYALRRIAADPMLHAELVDAGGIAASYLSLAAFESIFTQRVQAVAQALAEDGGDERKADAAFSALTQLCCAHEHMYVCAQRALSEAERAEPSNLVWRVIQQRLSAVAAQRSTRRAFELDAHVLGLTKFPPVWEALASVSSLTPLDVAKLYSAYSQPPGGPPVAFIQSEPLLVELLRHLFAFRSVGAGPSLESSFTSQALFLLALATSTRDGPARATDRGSFDDTLARLTAVQGVLGQWSPQRDGATPLLQLRSHLHVPVVAAGAVTFASSALCAGEYYVGGRHRLDSSLALLDCLAECGRLHPLLQPRVFAAARAALEFQPPLEARPLFELRKGTLSLLALLLLLGSVQPVCALLREHASRLERALVLHVLARLGEAAAPPFSAAFSRELGALLESDAVFKMLEDALVAPARSAMGDALLVARLYRAVSASADSSTRLRELSSRMTQE